MRFFACRLPSGCVNLQADVPAVPLPRVERVKMLVKLLADTVDPQAGLQVKGRKGLILVETEGDPLVLQHQLRLRQVEAVLEGLTNLLLLIDIPRIVRGSIDRQQYDVCQLAQQADIHDAFQTVFRGAQRVFRNEECSPRHAGNFGLRLQHLDGSQSANGHLLADLFQKLLGEGSLPAPHLQVLDAEHEVPIRPLNLLGNPGDLLAEVFPGHGQVVLRDNDAVAGHFGTEVLQQRLRDPDLDLGGVESIAQRWGRVLRTRGNAPGGVHVGLRKFHAVRAPPTVEARQPEPQLLLLRVVLRHGLVNELLEERRGGQETGV